jgi:hypothetical protein
MYGKFKVYEKTMKKNSKNMPCGIDYKRIKKDLAFVSSLPFVALAK